uniref:Mr_precursor_005 n=1 Tax=Conus marmoreus TaxID=42752 RepID=U6BZC9_CONMR|nr:Mr_precursor_005 [Conus marmoreus]
MSGHTSVNFLLLSIVALGMVATVICLCDSYISSELCEHPEETCFCPNHMCCPLSPYRQDQCMYWEACHIFRKPVGSRSTHMQKKFLRMPRDLADQCV